MENCCSELFYTKKDFEIPSLSNVTENDSLENCYFCLEIVGKNNKQLNFKKKDFAGHEAKVNYFDIFKGRRIVIYGRPGIGKTTLCKKIAYDFSKSNSNALTEKYDQMIWIESGRPNTFLKAKLESLLEDDYNEFVKIYLEEKSSRFQRKFLNTKFSTDFERVLILFDGFVEIQCLIDNCKQLQYLLKNIFLAKNVILTSRPYAKLANVFDCVDQELEIIGYAKETVQQVLQHGIAFEYASIFRTKIDSMTSRPGALCIGDNIWQNASPEKLYPELLKVLELTISNLWTENIVAIELLSKSRNFFKDFCFETFSHESSVLVQIKNFFDILRDAYVSKPFLTEVQKSTFLARELLSHKTAGKINLLTEILGRHQQSKHPNILDTICNNLDKDVLAVYYYDILEIFYQLKPSTSAAILVGYINSKNLRCLLPFLFKNGRIVESEIFIENNRLNYLGISSHPLTEKDVLFVQTFHELSKQDHHCHQAVIRTLIDGSFPEECETFFVKHDLVSLQKLGDQEFENRKLAKDTKYFKEFVEFHKYLSFLYSESFLRYNDEDNLHLAHLYGSYYFSPANNFTFGPFYIDLSNSNIDDDDIDVVVQFVEENRQQIHTLILSNNKIGKPGFQRLMLEVPSSQLKHLLLDRNVIQFDQVRFELVHRVARSQNLKTLDLSGNFISKDWIDKLTINGRNPPACEIDVKFCMLNQCKVIYKRNFSAGLAPALDLICKPSQKQNITEEIGCFGYAIKKDVFDKNGNQVLLITEVMADGQRNLKLSELFQWKDNTRFHVFSEYVDPYNDCNIEGIFRKSLVNRLKDYETPVYGYFSTSKILKILCNIQESKPRVDIGEYLVDEKKTQSSYSNCVQWANSVMNTESNFIIVEDKHSSLTILKQWLLRCIPTSGGPMVARGRVPWRSTF